MCSWQHLNFLRLINLRFLLILVVAGCNTGPVTDYSQLGLVEISGRITLDGEPVEGAAIFFYEEDETYCFGVTDADGRYTAMLNSEKTGCMPGDKRVEVSTTRNPLGDAATGEQAEEDPDAPRETVSELIPDCYTGGKSALRVTISSADSSLDFDLASDCSTTSSS